jgi:hypothetical protein
MFHLSPSLMTSRFSLRATSIDARRGEQKSWREWPRGRIKITQKTSGESPSRQRASLVACGPIVAALGERGGRPHLQILAAGLDIDPGFGN